MAPSVAPKRRLCFFALGASLSECRHPGSSLQPLTPAQTTDFYEVITERHRRASTVVTSNRDASEWLPLMTDPLLAQSAIDRLTSTCHELVVEGDLTAAASAPPRPQLTTRPQRHHDAHVTRPGGP